MCSDGRIGSGGFNDISLDELADSFELGVSRTQEERFCGVEEGAADVPGGG